MSGKVMPFLIGYKEFDEEIYQENHAYPECPFLEAFFFIKRHIMECIVADHGYQGDRKYKNYEVHDYQDSVAPEKIAECVHVYFHDFQSMWSCRNERMCAGLQNFRN